MFTVHEYDFGTYDDASYDQGPPHTSNAGIGFIPTNADAALLWRQRQEQINEIMQERTRPRVLTGVRP